MAAENLPLIQEILELAKWAPSGDNTQPWRFAVISDRRADIHGFDTRDHCVYDLGGRASHMALGALLENVILSAGRFGMRVAWQHRHDSPENAPIIELTFTPDEAVCEDSLVDAIRLRAVNRRPYRWLPLSPQVKAQLEAVVSELGYRVQWYPSLPARWKMVQLTSLAGKLRLSIPEAYPVHRDIIEWGVRFSEDRVPDQAIGLDPVTLRLTRWIMKRWERVRFFNTYFAGTVIPRLELDVAPGLACSAHFVLISDNGSATLTSDLTAGRALQRFWLQATALGVQLQPEMTPLIFYRYGSGGIRLSKARGAQASVDRVTQKFVQVVGENASQAVFMGRIGYADPVTARSIRLPWSRLQLTAQG